jgi:hypothetical protein
VSHKNTENGINRKFIICNLHQYYKNNYIKEDWMGGTCSKHGTGVNFIQTVTGKRERTIYFENLGTDLKITDEFHTNEMGKCGVDLSGSTPGPETGCCEHDNESPVPLKFRIFFIACQLSASQERLQFT